MPRLLILCTHNSARSQMAEGWARHHAIQAGVALDIWSAGSERTTVKPQAITVMAEVGIDLSGHTSKRLDELPDPWNFDLVLTVCDAANDTCPVYPARTRRLHVPIPDPSGEPLDRWRATRDAIGAMTAHLVGALTRGTEPDQRALRAAARPATTDTDHG
jgi:arsenate reductase (thioredoxin)